MTLEEEARLSCYQTVGVLNEAHQVYLVQHAESKQIFVKKILTNYDAEIFRFLKEHHVSGTPYIHELVLDRDRLILIEEYIPGTPLSQVLEEKGRLSEEETVSLIRRLCVPLQQMHAFVPPIIHRDIKPSNIILTASGDSVLLDMDAAKRAKPSAAEDTQLIGTVGFAAPEQYGFGSSDRRTDIYALGVLLNVCLTGALPKERMVEGRLAAVVAHATQMDPSARYPSVEAFLTDLLGQERTACAPAGNPNALPGFRSAVPALKIAAVFGYAFIIFLCFSLTVENASPAVIWINRIIAFLLISSVILFSGNYRNVWGSLRIPSIRPVWLRILVIVLLDLLIACFWMAVLLGIEKVLR